MARGDRAKNGVLSRIAASSHSITIKYPPRRLPVSGTAPALRPMTPLTGPSEAPAIVPGAPPTPEKADVVLKCLWYDDPTMGALGEQNNKRSFSPVAWRQGAKALIRVAVKDAALDPTAPYGKTVFDECETVEHAGLRYRILGLTRADAGFTDAYSFYIWLVTSEVG